jgi:dipeptidyl-peptidase-4
MAATSVVDIFTPAATAALGFIVVVVDARGTPFRSKDFSATSLGYLKHMGLEDHIAAITQLSERDASIDLTRVGISGTSFGGWTAIRALIDYPEFFKAGFAGVPPGSFHSMYASPLSDAFQGNPVYSSGSTLRTSASEVPENWLDINSPAQVGLIKGNLLVAFGELDENVLPGSTMQFIDAAIKQDANVEFIFVPGASHGAPYRPYVQRRVWKFFVNNLQEAEFPRASVFPGKWPVVAGH